MIKYLSKTNTCTILLLLLIATSFGCAPRAGQREATSDTLAYGRGTAEDSKALVNKRVRDYLAAEEAESNDPHARAVLLRTAKAALGTPYVRGGTSTDGFDCSGFVQWTFNQVGVKLPRTAREQSRVGRLIRNVDDMQVGDIVAFRHPKRGYHTGIYVGDGKFIHSPRKRTRVRINALADPYFSGTFLGARRVEVNSEADIAAAEKMLAEYRSKEQKKTRLTASDRNKKSSSAKLRAERSEKNKKQTASRGSGKDKNASKSVASRSPESKSRNAAAADRVKPVSKNLDKSASKNKGTAKAASSKEKTSAQKNDKKSSSSKNSSAASSKKDTQKDTKKDSKKDAKKAK